MNRQYTYEKNSLRTRYAGNTALIYDEKRSKRKKWRKEIEAATKIALQLEPASTILDIPIGTGRFLMPLKESSHKVYGIDITWDMISQAREKCANNPVDLILGDAMTIPLKNQSVDYVLCIRLVNWVMKETFIRLLHEFRRVARNGIIIGIRTEKRMNFTDFARCGIVNLLTNRDLMANWLKKIGNFVRKVKGKILHEFRKISGNEEKQVIRNKFFVHLFYGKEELASLLNEMGMEIKEEIHIDTLYKFAKWQVQPYSIYYLRFMK